MSIDWGSVVLVIVVALAAGVVITGSYSFGLRLLEASRGDADAAVAAPNRVALAGAIVLFAIAIAAVLFGVWLIVPQFH